MQRKWQSFWTLRWIRISWRTLFRPVRSPKWTEFPRRRWTCDDRRWCPAQMQDVDWNCPSPTPHIQCFVQVDFIDEKIDESMDERASLTEFIGQTFYSFSRVQGKVVKGGNTLSPVCSRSSTVSIRNDKRLALTTFGASRIQSIICVLLFLLFSLDCDALGEPKHVWFCFLKLNSGFLLSTCMFYSD